MAMMILGFFGLGFTAFAGNKAPLRFGSLQSWTKYRDRDEEDRPIEAAKEPTEGNKSKSRPLRKGGSLRSGRPLSSITCHDDDHIGSGRIKISLLQVPKLLARIIFV